METLEKENLKRNSEVEKYNNWNGKFTTGFQRQIWTVKKRACELKTRVMEIIKSKIQREKKFEEKWPKPNRTTSNGLTIHCNSSRRKSSEKIYEEIMVKIA
jgi:hypothetical protein